MMARLDYRKWNRRSFSHDKARRHHVVGVGTAAGIFLAAAMTPLATAPIANADADHPIISTVSGSALFDLMPDAGGTAFGAGAKGVAGKLPTSGGGNDGSGGAGGAGGSGGVGGKGGKGGAGGAGGRGGNGGAGGTGGAPGLGGQPGQGGAGGAPGLGGTPGEPGQPGQPG
jgi:hypothetical protein